MKAGKVKVRINGEERVFENDLTLLELLGSMGLPEKSVFIEYNREPLDRSLYSETRIKEGDVMEIVTMMAGG
ncbi:MAG: sulfur carrier protein ThiS [Nitrospinota bacterium]|nr:sulfur carrier protein ThiS [Nitrospinota bacterium]